MRSTLVFVIMTLLSLCSYGQKLEYLYNSTGQVCQQQDAVFYAQVEKTDSGWHKTVFYIHLKCEKMHATYEDSSCKILNGTYCTFYPNKKVDTIGNYIHGLKQGIWNSFFSNGDQKGYSDYVNDVQRGVSISYYRSGMMKDSIYMYAKGKGTQISWWENGRVSSAGYLKDFVLPDGIWNFYHENGQLSAKETYTYGSIVKGEYYDENGKKMDTPIQDRVAEYPGGMHEWTDYLSKNLYFPSSVQLKQPGVTYCKYSLTVGTDGKLKDVEIIIPYFLDFDRVVLNTILKNKISWNIAVSHNRKIPYNFVSSVKFQQLD